MTSLVVPTTFGMDWKSPPKTLPPHARFIRSINWAATALGPPETWPNQLHQMLDLILADPTPSAIMWGENHTMIYNEAFVEFAGSKHPLLMGGTPIVSYAEVWEPQFATIIKLGRETGCATRHRNVPLSLQRHGYMEECFVNYTFVPIPGPDKVVIGFYHTAVETTNENLSKRRTQTLIDIGDNAGAARSMKEYWEAALKGFESNIWDIPYAVAYEFRNESEENSIAGSGDCSYGSDSHRSASLSGSASSAGTGLLIPRFCSLAGVIGKSISQVPLSLDVSDEDDGFHQTVKTAIRSGQIVQLNANDGKMPEWLDSDAPGRAFEEAVTSAVVMPIRPTTRNDAEGNNAIGFVIIGINPRRGFDEDYKRYTRLWSRQLATSAASVVLLEQEMARQRRLTAQLSISAKQAQESEARFSRFAEMSNVAMWITNIAGRVLYGNNAWHDQMKNMVGNEGMKSWLGCVSDEHQPRLKEAWRTIIEDKTSVSFEARLKPASSTEELAVSKSKATSRWLLCSAFPEIADDGSIKAVWGCNTDITHQKVAEDLKEQRLLDVLEAKRQSESFIDTVSHEMRNPLSAILQCADGVNSAVAEAQQASNGQKYTLFDTEAVDYLTESIQTIILCAQHQKRIINDILTLSKLDARLLVVTPTEVDPVETVRHALRLHQQEFQNADVGNGIRIEQSYHCLNVDRVLLDPSRLLQVLINLLTNAIKFTQFQEERMITVSIGASIESPAKQENSIEYFTPRASQSKIELGEDWGIGEDLFVHFSVNDTGCGLTSAEMQNLFLRFSQASPKTHVRYGGSGLGLFICKELTEMQGGRIGVSSIPGKGSNFKFYIKARRAIAPKNELDDVTRNKESNKHQSELAKPGKKSRQDDIDRLHVTDRNYIAPMNRSHSASQNPVVGSPSDPNTLHVLVVEDNLINQKVMAQQLRKAKCVVHVANHGADALFFLETTTFAKDTGPSATPLSIVLMDLEMPVMDGLTCVRKIREWQKSGKLTKPVPVIAVTANARIEQITMAKDAGMDDVVTKPFRIPDLIPHMHNLIDKTSA